MTFVAAIALALASAIPPGFADFFAAKSYVESRHNPRAVNQRDGGPALQAAERLRSSGRLPECGYPLEDYAWSGGLYGQIPALALVVAFEGTDEVCEDPKRLHEPAFALRTALAYARKLQQWKAYRKNPSWETLWLGFRAPALMGDHEHPKAQISLANLKKGLRATGGKLRGRPPRIARSA